MRFYILFCLAATAHCRPGIIHDSEPQIEEKMGGHEGLIGESSHHHHIEHEHAKSHQSIKFEHFHPVPVYVKKEHSHLLKHPLEKGKFEHTLKQIHPEHEHKIGGGLVLEDHRFDTEQHAGFHDHSDNLHEIVHVPEHHEELKGWAESAPVEHHFAPSEGQHYEYQHKLEGGQEYAEDGGEGYGHN